LARLKHSKVATVLFDAVFWSAVLRFGFLSPCLESVLGVSAAQTIVAAAETVIEACRSASAVASADATSTDPGAGAGAGQSK
jgi:hypothetical protein